MTDYNGYGAATTTGQGGGAGAGLVWQPDNGAYTFGQTFTVDTSGLSVKGARWYLPDGTTDGPTTGYMIGLWEVGNPTAIATAGPFTATVGAWNEGSFSSPVAISASPAEYRIGVLFPGGYYSAQTPNAVPWNPAGPINFPSTGTYNSGASLTYPTSSPGTAPVYGIDVTVTDGASGSGTSGISGGGTAASSATTASGSGSVPLNGSGTAASGVTTATGVGTGPVAAASSTRISRLLARLWFTESIGIERLLGDGAYGPSFDLIDVEGAAIDHGSKEVLTPTGDSAISTARVFLPVETDAIPIGSRVTLPDAHGGGTFLVISANTHRAAQAVPEHLELSLQ